MYVCIYIYISRKCMPVHIWINNISNHPNKNLKIPNRLRLRNSKVALADFRISFDLAPGTPLGDGVEGSFFMETRRKGGGWWGSGGSSRELPSKSTQTLPVMGFSGSMLVGEMVVYSFPLPPPPRPLKTKKCQVQNGHLSDKAGDSMSKYCKLSFCTRNSHFFKGSKSQPTESL